MDFRHKYLKKGEARINTEGRSGSIYGARICPTQNKLVDCGVSLFCPNYKGFRRQTTELQKYAVTKWLFPGKEPEWQFDELVSELEQLTNPTKWLIRLPVAGEKPDWLDIMQEKGDCNSTGRSHGDVNRRYGGRRRSVSIASPVGAGQDNTDRRRRLGPLPVAWMEHGQNYGTHTESGRREMGSRASHGSTQSRRHLSPGRERRLSRTISNPTKRFIRLPAAGEKPDWHDILQDKGDCNSTGRSHGDVSRRYGGRRSSVSIATPVGAGQDNTDRRRRLRPLPVAWMEHGQNYGSHTGYGRREMVSHASHGSTQSRRHLSPGREKRLSRTISNPTKRLSRLPAAEKKPDLHDIMQEKGDCNSTRRSHGDVSRRYGGRRRSVSIASPVGAGQDITDRRRRLRPLPVTWMEHGQNYGSHNGSGRKEMVSRASHGSSQSRRHLSPGREKRLSRTISNPTKMLSRLPAAEKKPGWHDIMQEKGDCNSTRRSRGNVSRRYEGKQRSVSIASPVRSGQDITDRRRRRRRPFPVAWMEHGQICGGHTGSGSREMGSRASHGSIQSRRQFSPGRDSRLSRTNSMFQNSERGLEENRQTMNLMEASDCPKDGIVLNLVDVRELPILGQCTQLELRATWSLQPLQTTNKNTCLRMIGWLSIYTHGPTRDAKYAFHH
ncbi:hypothetical protein J6590_068528 [Homalodisca vitripennis]|nr:hypothetical protein J6590_068528 [Homalodisca vitripennis]